MASIEPPDLLCYLSEFRVIVCLSCQYALQPNGISRHLKDIHHILRSQRKPFLEYVSAFDLDDPENVIQSTKDLKQFPVPLLPVMDGLKCNHQDCPYLCIAEKRMRNHWTLEHGRPGQLGLDWGSVLLQTFFRGNSLKYFTKSSVSFSSVIERQSKTGFIGDNETALLQHYITFTSPTLADGIQKSSRNIDSSLKLQDAQVSIWQEVIPQLAKENQFLMHGIFACAALHLAYLDPSERQSYIVKASEYQDLPMAPSQEAVRNLNSMNCHAVFAFFHILGIISFASERENERLLVVGSDGADAAFDWLSFLRSGCDYVHSVRDSVERGPVRAFLCEWKMPMSIYNGPPTSLVKQLLNVIPLTDSEDAWSVKECEIYSSAVNELGHAFVFAERLGKSFNTWDALRAWPMMLSLDFFRLLQDSHPGALIALAHYYLLLHRLDEKWYFQGRSKRLLGHILQRLDSKWHSYVDFSLQPES